MARGTMPSVRGPMATGAFEYRLRSCAVRRDVMVVVVLRPVALLVVTVVWAWRADANSKGAVRATTKGKIFMGAKRN